MLTTSMLPLIVAAASLSSTDANVFNGKSKMPRIIGGRTAVSHRYPYTVALTNGGSDFFCGGSLIAPDVVLTAAHCLGGDYSVAIGRSDLTSNDGEEIRVDKEIEHPNYSFNTDENDFALLLLSRPVRVLSQDDMVRINSDESFPSPGDMSRTMGWGDTDPDDSKSEVSYDLLEVDLPVISNLDCKSAKGSTNGYSDSYEDYIFDNMLCTFKPGQDACQGDSGGPLIIPGSTPSQDILIGVTSWGIGCATKVFPGVFARVSNAYEWIAETVCDKSESPPGYLCGTTSEPTDKPSASPTFTPTADPTTSEPTEEPSSSPTPEPTADPTNKPTPEPTTSPVTASPTLSPSEFPTNNPTMDPTSSPITSAPTAFGSDSPSLSISPTTSPTYTPTLRPSLSASDQPSKSPSSSPSTTSDTPSPATASSLRTTTSLTPTPKPFGDNSLLIPISSVSSPEKDAVVRPISSLLSPEKDEAVRVSSGTDQEDYEISGSSRCSWLLGLVLSGILSVYMMA